MENRNIVNRRSRFFDRYMRPPDDGCDISKSAAAVYRAAAVFVSMPVRLDFIIKVFLLYCDFSSGILPGEDLLVLLHIFLVGLRFLRDFHFYGLDLRTCKRTFH